MNTTEAFEALFEVVNDELEKAQKEGAAHFTRGDTQQVRRIAERVEKLQALIKSVRDLQSQWHTLIPEMFPEEQDQKKLAPGKKTSLKEYRVPILRALVELGGSAPVDQALKKVEGLMSGVLKEIDYQMLPSRKEVRWRNTAKWERWSMVQDGLLNKEAPYGTWEITDKGREYLKQNK